jgi:hypothetical protein
MNPGRSSSPSEHAISRRRLLRRIGAGAAVAWSAPILTSIQAPAFAQPSPSRPCDPDQVCVPDCDVPRQCQGGNCGCFRIVDSSDCWCGDLKDGFCESFTPCETLDDCPGPVDACVATCCPTGICMSVCGSSSSRGLAGKGRELTQ